MLTAIFPRNDNMAVMPTINAINRRSPRSPTAGRSAFSNVNDGWPTRCGALYDGMMHDGLHPTVRGYQVWADALKPMLTELLGPPAARDQRRRRPVIRGQRPDFDR